MRRTSLSIAAGLTAVLLVSGTPAQAAVSAKDLPKKGDIVKAFPELADAEFTSFTSTKNSAPGATCDTSEIVKVKRLASIRGVSSAGASFVQSTVIQHSSAAKVKAYLKSYKRYAKDCASFTQSATGGTVTTTLGKAPKLGQSTVMLQQETTVGGVVSYSNVVFIGDGKRSAAVVAIDDAAIPASAIKQLAKVTAKKMK
ncbi:hypothetical protein IEZ26_11450 [Nocardioides cavernae]|uniref:Sensor domain-containing protein n=1 Tax=Nocardioides cavernae TaxID=1921566 RepID=A0ABR8NAU1_9ACTN|nr:hypothetical protein [Nocardioides cavernae]MBD3925241.1 hypothetical protein [Nocardioides cavernae]MBM7514380.1 hypothetical protein [Nocardioides cavernae]